MEKPTINILMVDDRPENLQALEAVLESSDYELIKAHSGEEALKWVLIREFAVILMDVQMPGIDGFETAKLIRARKKSQQIPIIFITALTQTQDYALSGYSAGAIDFLFKPFNPFILKSKVEGFVKIYISQWELQKKNELLLRRSAELDRANSQLKKSESIARAISETSLDTICTVDKSGNILSVNQAATTMFGYKEDEFDHLSKMIPLFQTQSLQASSLKLMFETTANRKNGTSFPVEIQLNQIIEADQDLYVCSIRDITERKNQLVQLEKLVEKRTEELRVINTHLQREIQEKLEMVKFAQISEEKYRKLVDHSPLAIVVLELGNNKWSFINETGIKMLGGTTSNDILSKDLLHFVHPDDHGLVKDRLMKISKGERVGTVEEKFVRLDGEVIDVEVSLIPFDYFDNPAVHIVIRDITEIKRTQEYISQSEKLSVVGELAAGIAHEIRNPLTSLRGFTQLLVHKDETTSNPYVPIMLSEIDRINTIVGELLLLAKPNQEDFRTVEITDLLHTVIILMNTQANLHNIEIKFACEKHSKSMIHGLENKLKQVFINLIKNAIEAMPSGGEIVIQLTQFHDHISIEIKDEGCGIPMDILSKVGQPFFTTKEKGTGLGLMVCKSIIESHQGTMRIKSYKNNGTTVILDFPILTQATNSDELIHT
ncbi:PAS domain S-box protein [Bacillus salitolerans]|uniref:histidine kinase n=1 Tax=Bacillus salitolerans TaxID=1437434 RepID=A0ABW4LYG4_9BACI